MSTFRLFLSILAVVSLLALGAVSAYAQGAQSTCPQTFQQYAGDKDYMNQDDFKEYWATDHTDVDTESQAFTSGAYSAFLSANTNHDNKLSQAEFCTWLKNQPS
jgi:hypothetical protein